MGAALTTVVFTVFMLNAFLIAVGEFDPSLKDKGDISAFINNTEGAQPTMSEGASSIIPVTPPTQTVDGGADDFNFVDSLRTPFKMINIIMKLILGPLNMAAFLGLPNAITLIFFAPLTLLYYLGILVVIRGGGG